MHRLYPGAAGALAVVPEGCNELVDLVFGSFKDQCLYLRIINIMGVYMSTHTQIRPEFRDQLPPRHTAYYQRAVASASVRKFNNTQELAHTILGLLVAEASRVANQTFLVPAERLKHGCFLFYFECRLNNHTKRSSHGLTDLEQTDPFPAAESDRLKGDRLHAVLWKVKVRSDISGRRPDLDRLAPIIRYLGR